MPQGVVVKSVVANDNTTPAISLGAQFQGNPEVLGEFFEGNVTTINGGTTFKSLGPVQFNNIASRAKLRVNIPTGGTIPVGGMQFQILAKESENAPWTVYYSWANIQALTAGPPSGDSPLVVFTDQSSIVFPANSNVTFDMDVRGLFAVDVQASVGAGSGPATAQLFCGEKRKA